MDTNITIGFENSTAIPPNYSLYIVAYSLHILSLVIYCLVFILGLLGNGVVIWATGFRMKKTVNTVWFLNLAIADFLFTLLLPMSIVYIASNFHWHFGNFMCRFNALVNSLNMFASIYILMVISIDRYVSVVWPVWAQNNRNVRKASFVSLGVWILALIHSIPYFVFRDTEDKQSNIICHNDYTPFSDNMTLGHFRHRTMIISRLFLGFVIPFSVIVFCYTVIIHHLRRNPTLASHSSRTLKIIAAVITIFFICWAPFHVISLIDMVYHTTENPSQALILIVGIGSPIATSLAFLNSCLNPLLYVFMGQDLKEKIRKSILSVLETAFQEENTLCDTKSADSHNRDKMIANTDV